MAPPDMSIISPTTTGITTGPSVYLGPNAKVTNVSTGGLDIGSLQLKTLSTLNSNGINISNDGSQSKLTINSSGELRTSGLINTNSSVTASGSLNSTSLNITHTPSGSAVMTVSDSGAITASDDLKIANYFLVTASTGHVSSGSMNVVGTVDTTGTITVATNKASILNDGSAYFAAGNFAVSAAGSLNINSKFTVDYATGNTYSSGDLKVDGKLDLQQGLKIGNYSSPKFIVDSASGNTEIDGSLYVGSTTHLVGTTQIDSTVTVGSGKIELGSSDGHINAAGDFNINSGKFTVSASTGATHMDGTLTVSDKLTIDSTNGKLSTHGSLIVGSDYANPTFHVDVSDGKAVSQIAYSTYVLPDSATNETTTLYSGTEPSAVSSTSTYLTTQEYVDKQLWQQTKRINTIVGFDAAKLDTFQNVYKMIDTIAGHSDVVTTLAGINDKYGQIVDQTSEVKMSMSDIVANAYNPITINAVPSVWADACEPMPIPSSADSTFLEDGWYFKNFNAGQKINWYTPANGVNMTLGDIQNLILNVYAVSNKSLPFITVYTQAKGSNDYINGLWNARINFTYSTPAGASNTAKVKYSLYTKEQPYNIYNSTPVQCSNTSTTTGANKVSTSGQGSILDGYNIDTTLVSLTDKVYCFSIGTNSGANASDVEMIVQSFAVKQKTGTTEFIYNNAAVATAYLFNFLYHKNIDLSAFPTLPVHQTYLSSYNNVNFSS
jgi:hypothetical protein